jgi:hypothetical protein
MITFVGGIVGLCFWQMRRHMYIVRRSIVFGLIFLQLNMKAPIYALLGRFSFVDGSTGWQRVNLFDQWVRHWPQWIFVGVRIETVASWAWGVQDITNHFIFTSIEGGLLAMILYIALITKGFKIAGNCIKQLNEKINIQKFIWAIATVLLAEIISFFGVSYFGNFIFFNYMLFGIFAFFSNYYLKDTVGSLTEVTLKGNLLTN